MLPITLLALAAPLLTSALYIPSNTTHLNPARSDPGVYYCNGPDFTLNCFWVAAPSKKCTPMDVAPTGSFGPDHGLTCKIYSDPLCELSAIGGVRYPGIAHLDDGRLKRIGVIKPQGFSCELD